MRVAVSALLLSLVGGEPCAHQDRGATRPMDLDAVERAYRDTIRMLSMRLEAVSFGDPLSGPFDAGWPACRGRTERHETVAALPRELVGRRIHFGPKPVVGAIHVVTAAPALREALGAIIAGPELAERFRIRCAPATVTVLSETRVVIHEGP